MKPFRFRIIHYDERVRDIHGLEKHLPLHLMKVGGFQSDYWAISDKEFNKDVI